MTNTVSEQGNRSYREPSEYSMRAPWGKGIAYGEVDGRGVIHITTPAFFLHALEA